MARYRVLEVRDKLISKGKPYYVVQKHKLGLWWSEYFEEHTEHGATYWDKDEAITWWEYHCDNATSDIVTGKQIGRAHV